MPPVILIVFANTTLRNIGSKGRSLHRCCLRRLYRQGPGSISPQVSLISPRAFSLSHAEPFPLSIELSVKTRTLAGGQPPVLCKDVCVLEERQIERKQNRGSFLVLGRGRDLTLVYICTTIWQFYTVSLHSSVPTKYTFRDVMCLVRKQNRVPSFATSFRVWL